MFNDIWIARKSALSLARNLMVATMIIAVGTHQYAVITADDLDSSHRIVNEYDPFASGQGGRKVPFPFVVADGPWRASNPPWPLLRSG